MEAEFLATLFKVRQLGSEFDAKFETLKARRAARQQRSSSRIATLQDDVAALQAGLQAGRTSFAELQHQLLVWLVVLFWLCGIICLVVQCTQEK